VSERLSVAEILARLATQIAPSSRPGSTIQQVQLRQLPQEG